VGGLVTVSERGGGGEKGGGGGEVAAGRFVGASRVAEVGTVFLRVVKTAVKVERALSVLAFDGGTGGGSTVVGPGCDAVIVAVSPAETVWAKDNVEVTEEVAWVSDGDARGVQEVVVVAVETGIDACVCVVEVMNGCDGVGEAGAVAVVAVFEGAGDGVVRGCRALSSGDGGSGDKGGSWWRG